MDDGVKTCPHCGETKPLDQFARCAATSTGRQAYCRACRSKMNAARRALPEVAARIKEKNAARLAKRRALVLAHYGGACACCGESEAKFLAIDHVDGGGVAHRKADPSALTIVSWIIRNGFPGGFRVLCHNCNTSIGHYGYCPHAVTA